MKKYQYQNVDQDDLWEELNKQAHQHSKLPSDLTMKQIMDTWTLQKGYPVITCTRLLHSENNTLTLKLTQKWFRLNSNNRNSNEEHKWYVPFTFTTSDQMNFDFESEPHWLKPGDESLHVNVLNPDDDNNLESKWIIGNLKFSGYYRVNYDRENWLLLIDQLKTNHSKIDFVNRAQLIADSFNLAKANLLDYQIFLNLISYLENETEYLPFKTVKKGLVYFQEMIESDYAVTRLFKVCFKFIY